ncbi:MAG: hypothetical protein AAGA59_22405, partial [Actinomycetota bacterium]
AVGPAAALPHVALADPVTGVEAARRGLVHEVADDPDGRACGLAHRLAGLDPVVVAAARRALRAAGDLPLEQGLDVEAGLAAAAQRAAQPPSIG